MWGSQVQVQLHGEENLEQMSGPVLVASYCSLLCISLLLKAVNCRNMLVIVERNDLTQCALFLFVYGSESGRILARDCFLTWLYTWPHPSDQNVSHRTTPSS